MADVTGDFTYARLQRSAEQEPSGYAARDLDCWTERCRLWADGHAPVDHPSVEPDWRPLARRGPCFIYFVSGAKVRNPAAAMALIERVRTVTPFGQAA